MWKEKLNEIIEEKELYQEKINSGASIDGLQTFLAEVKKAFHFELPQEYIDMLKTFNGLEFNGLILYGIDEQFAKNKINQHINGFIENNQAWYENEWQKKYIFFGDGNISWYVLDIEKNKFQELDKPSGELVQEFETFPEMLEYALEISLA